MEINKDLIAASSTPIVLAILAERDSYGYAILQRVREVSQGSMEWTDGMLYPVLHRLERLGYVEAHWETAETGRKRKYYRITSSGRAQLLEEQRQWQAVNETLRGIWNAIAIEVPEVNPTRRTARANWKEIFALLVPAFGKDSVSHSDQRHWVPAFAGMQGWGAI
jgi:PadR family transcriptional regulator PadR